MSNSGEKLRALFLASLMVLSVMAGTVAISGTAAANATAVTATNAGNTVGDTVDVTITLDNSNGETVVVENVVNGEVKENITVTDGGPGDDDGSEDGSISLDLTAGKADTGPGGTVHVTDEAGNELTDTYNTGLYLVQPSQDSVIHGETQTIEWTIYEFPGDPADSRTFEYELYYNDNDGTPGDQSLADSDVNDGSFITTQTFDERDNSYRQDYPDDANAGPAYEVYITAEGGDPAPGNGANLGSASIDVRLDVSVTSTTPDPLVYQSSADIVGNVQNASSPVSGYNVELIKPDGTSVQTKTTAQNGDFGFTAVVNDAGDWGVGTDVGGFIDYIDVGVDSQEADVQFDVASDARINFDSQFSIQLNDSRTNAAIDTSAGNVDGYVNVSGPFEDAAPTTVSAGTFLGSTDTDGDGDYEYYAFDSNANGNVTFTDAPTDATQEVVLKGADGTNEDIGLEVTDDAGNTPGTPDYVGSNTTNIGVAQPVNILNFDVEDSRTSNFDPANPTAATPDGNEASIFTDNGPEEVEPLPLANANNNRIVQGLRLGNDRNRGFDEITTYRVTFSLVDIQSDSIRPGGSAAAPELNNITFVGAGIDTTATMGTNNTFATSYTDNNGGAMNVLAVRETATDGNYVAIIRPTRVDTPDEQVKLMVGVEGFGVTSTGDTGQPDSVNTSGLHITEFQVDGETVNQTQANQTINVSSRIENAETSPTFVNNGRVNLTQRQNTGPATVETVQLRSTDARTKSINNGLYDFNNVQVGPRGLDTDGDGIGEDVAQLVFTAYQYADADGNNALERDEVNNATVETLPLALNNNLKVEFDAENTSKYSAAMNGGDSLTVTHGIEYERIAFTLTNNQTGNPVNLTDGLFNQKVALDDLSNPNVAGNTNPILVSFTDGDGDVIRVDFNETASRPGDGYYVIEDLEEETTSTDAVLSESGGLNGGDTFAFDSSGTPNSTSSYNLTITTPGLTNATMGSTGMVNVQQPQITYDVHGVAGQNVPNSQKDTNNDGAVFDQLAHDQTDNLNTSRNISKASAVTNRTYRLNGTVTDALGTPLNISDFSRIVIDYNGDGPAESGSINVVAGPGVNPTDTDEVDIQNENGSFQVDYEANMVPSPTGGDGIYKQNVTVRAYDGTADPSPFAGFTSTDGGYVDTQMAYNPVVEVYDENGGELPQPTERDAYNPPFVLAKDPVTNDLRVEAFPKDVNDFPLGDGLVFSMIGPAAETQVTTTTQNVSAFPNTEIATENRSIGQVGFLSITPTGTGEGIITLNSGAPPAGPVVLDTEGNRIRFNVQRSNRQLDLSVTPASPDQDDDFTIQAIDNSTTKPVDQVTVFIEAPDGTTTTVLTNETGQVTVDANVTDEGGEYQLTTRRAGYAPASASFRVSVPIEFTVSNIQAPANATVGETISVNATITNEGNQAAQKTVEFRFDGSTVASKSRTVLAGASTTVNFEVTVPDVAAGTYTHGIYTPDDNQTAQITVEAAQQPNPTLPGAQGPTTNLDSDPALEDVNGDGSYSVLDLQALFANLNSATVQNNVDDFDHNDDGQVTLLDIQALFAEQS